jgi:hypothetical protein
MAPPLATSNGLAFLARPCNARHVAAMLSPSRDARHRPALLSLRGQMVTMPGVKLPGWHDHAPICRFAPHYGGGIASGATVSVRAARDARARLMRVMHGTA